MSMPQISTTKNLSTCFEILANRFVKDRLKELGVEVVNQNGTVLFDQQQTNVNLKTKMVNLQSLFSRYYQHHWAKYSNLNVEEIDMDDFGFKARFINSTTQNNCSTVSTKDVTIHSFYACLNNNVQYFCETDDILYVINKFNSVDLEHTAQLNQDPKRGGKLHFILPQVSQDINIPKDSTNDIDSDMKDDVECVSYHERIVVESVFCARKYAIRGLFFFKCRT